MPSRRICLIPLDSRPVCYDLPVRLAEMAGVEVCLPSANVLGKPAVDLKLPANFKALQRWIKNHLFENDPVIVATDTVLYGGLIPSRNGDEPQDVLENRLKQLLNSIRAPKVYAFSSIMRIPSYNNDQEEPEYWRRYGEKLYQFSMQMHEHGQADQELAQSIPVNIREDFLNRRRRNFAMNQRLLDVLKQKHFDYLVFAKDDTGPFGLNVQEADKLTEAVDSMGLGDKAHIQTGADEVACTLITRWMSSERETPVKVFPFYSSDAGRKLVARFDGLPIDTVVKQQISACGAKAVSRSEQADIWLLVHTPESIQGDHCANIQAKVTSAQVQRMLSLMEKAKEANKPVILADVAYANGGDPMLVDAMMSRFRDLSNLYGYAGWNTPGNTLGSALSFGLVRWMAEQQGTFDSNAFKQLMAIRFADDWLYQACIRSEIRRAMEANGGLSHPPDPELLNVSMSNGLELIRSRFQLGKASISCSFPCRRLFEIAVDIKPCT